MLTIHVQNIYSYLYIDLIDMRHMPQNGCNWILHIVDHWSKFNFAFPLVKKKANHVIKVLHNYVFQFLACLLSFTVIMAKNL